MRFITIKNYEGENLAINIKNITAIKQLGPYVAVCMSGDTPITTQFTNVESAVDYIQRAPSMSSTPELS
jgi:hypothetical protein